VRWRGYLGSSNISELCNFASFTLCVGVCSRYIETIEIIDEIRLQVDSKCREKWTLLKAVIMRSGEL
jgi:hypothetical protein